MHLIISNLDQNLIQKLNQQIKSRQNKRKTDQGWMQFIFNRLKTSIYSDTTAEYQEHSYRSFCSIYLTINILEGWDIIFLKGFIHRYIFGKNFILCNIVEPRYKQKNIGYQIRRFENIRQSCNTFC